MVPVRTATIMIPQPDCIRCRLQLAIDDRGELWARISADRRVGRFRYVWPSWSEIPASCLRHLASDSFIHLTNSLTLTKEARTFIVGHRGHDMGRIGMLSFAMALKALTI